MDTSRQRRGSERKLEISLVGWVLLLALDGAFANCMGRKLRMPFAHRFPCLSNDSSNQEPALSH